MASAVRSPGSTLKPFIYGLAFEAGLAHPETLIEDRPVRFGTYAPKNFDDGYHGTVTIREALANSLNIPAVKVLDAVGPGQARGALPPRRRHPRLSRQGRADARHGARRHGADAARPRDALRQRGARRRCRGAPIQARRSASRRPASAARRQETATRRARAVAARRLVRDRHPQGRAAAAQRQGRPLRLQDRHLVRLPRRLGHRLRRQVHGRRVGRPPRRRLDAGPRRPPRRRADAVRCLRPPRHDARAPRRARPPAPSAPRDRICRRR